MQFKAISKILLLATTLVLTGCASQYSITEKDIEKYLNKEMHFETKQGNQLVGIALTLNDMDVSLGDKPEMISVTANAEIKVNNPIFPISADLVTTFEAKPWYDAKTKSIYLKHLELVNVESSPKDIESIMTQVSPQIMTFVSGFLQNHPVYTLDESDSAQALMAKMTKEIEVQKGKIVVKF